ncbi:molybdenum cofactor biosynthesis protein MoaE [Roseospira goensis]|uniref:Molybdopterin synthase catalytic subunit n=1 Tax=Roseospira goensis TaxID=391922 RepID=A0A7W6WM59_9PROT|nr:molybdopterin synthase catalytic subunit [Roseospira goensis]
MIRVQTEPFDVGAEIGAFCRAGGSSGGSTGGSVGASIGGVATFVGLVRDHRGDTSEDAVPLQALTLEHYPGMTERQLERIEAEARRRWDLRDVLVIHRYGRMEPEEPIVLVCTAAAHRGPALQSCQFLIDWLKTRAPFWKCEETPDGAHWVEARDTDEAATARWEESLP